MLRSVGACGHGLRKLKVKSREPDGRSQNCYFLGGAMVSLAALATRNLTTVLALILMASPV